MLIALYFFIVNVVIPQIGAFAYALLEPTMIIVIILGGLIMLFGVVGIRISSNLSSTIVGGIFKGIGYIGQTIIKAIGWIISTIVKFIPRVFIGSRKAFTQMGLNTVVSNILAVVITVLVVVIII